MQSITTASHYKENNMNNLIDLTNKEALQADFDFILGGTYKPTLKQKLNVLLNKVLVHDEVVGRAGMLSPYGSNGTYVCYMKDENGNYGSVTKYVSSRWAAFKLCKAPLTLFLL